MDVKVAQPSGSTDASSTIVATTEAASATTLSTIVIRAAPHTKIVIGILKSLGYVQLRIDEMDPCLLELGANLAVTTKLIDVHKDLCVRLESKQQQVDDLLSRAKSLANTQTTREDALVYTAMAESLVGAWRELTRQLELRGFLLAETRRFFELVERHENAAGRTSALICDTANAVRVDVDDVNLNTTLERIKQSVNGLAELTAEAADAGAQVITHTRVLGALADNAQRPREVADACIAIENVMLRLAGLWEGIDALWHREREHFNLLKASTMAFTENNTTIGEQQLNVAAAWLNAARQTYATAATIGAGSAETRQTAGELLPQVEKRRLEIASDEKLRVDALTSKRANLLCNFDEFHTILVAKLGHADKLEQFYTNADTVLNQLTKMSAELRAADTNASMAGELGPLAYQKAGVQIDEGEALLRLDAMRVDNEACRRVNNTLDALRAALSDVDALARERIAIAKTVNAKVQAELGALSKWLADDVEAFLNSERGAFEIDRAACAKFHAEHKKIIGELAAREPELNAVLGHAQTLAASDRRRCADLRRRFDDARDRLEARIALARDFEQFQKFSRDVDASLDAAQINGAIDAGERVPALHQTVREALQREKHYGEKLLFATKAMEVVDPRLQMSKACTHVDETIRSHESRLIESVARDDAYQSAQTTTRHVRTLMDEVLIWERSIERLIYQVEDHLRANETAIAPSRVEFERLREQRTEFTRQIIEALERLPQINRKTCEARNGAATVNDASLSAEMRAFVERFGDGVTNAREPLARLQTRLQRLREEICKQTIHIETIVIESEQLRAPRILDVLHDIVVTEGTAVELSTGYDGGQPPAGVVWLRDGRPLAGDACDRLDFRLSDSRATLHIADASIDDSAIYTLRAENAAGAAKTMARLTVTAEQSVNEKPRLVKPLQNVVATTGQQLVILDCVIVGSPEPKVIWYKEEECLCESDHITLRFLDDRCVLEIHNVDAEDAGLYKIQAVNTHGESVSFCQLSVTPSSPIRGGKMSAPLKKPFAVSGESLSDAATVVQAASGRQPPVFDISLAGQTVNEGDRVLFQAHLSGACWPAEIVWLLNDERIPNPVDGIRVETDDKSGFVRLHIQEATLRLVGVYAVVARNEAGEARSAATLRLFNQSTSDFYKERNVHNHNELIVREYGGSTSQRYFYRSDSSGILKTPSAASSAAPSPRPFIQSPYTSSPSHDVGDMCYNSIANAPEFIRPLPAEHTIDEGERVIVDCLLVGNPRPRIQWTFNDRPLKSSHQFVELTNVGDTYTLNFTPARLEHAGYYRMVAENVRGRAESLTLLYVRPRSMIPQPVGSTPGRTARKTQSFEQQRMMDEFDLYGMARGRTVAPTRSTTAFPGAPAVATRRSVGLPIRRQQPYFSPQKMHYNIGGYGSSDGVMSASVYQPHELYSSDYGTHSSSVVRTSTTSMQSSYGSPYYQSQYISPQQQKEQQKFDELTRQQYDIHVVSCAQGRDQQHVLQEKNLNEELQQQKQEQQLIHNIVRQTGPKEQAEATPPHFKQTLASCVITVGNAAVFDAAVNGVPQPQLEWFKNGEPIADGKATNRLTTQSGTDGRVTLHIDSVAPADAGNYMCTAKNASGMATSSAQLVVRSNMTAPDFVKRLISKEVMEDIFGLGERLKWSVSIVANPQPVVVWLREDQPIPNCGDVRLVQEGPGEYAMIIERVESADAGQFTCLAKNEAGEARSTADLIVRPTGSQPGSYFHITKVTQENQLKGEKMLQNEVICVNDGPPDDKSVDRP